MTARVLAITGGTGFVGQTLIRMARAQGWEVRALTRKPQDSDAGLYWVVGELSKPATLRKLLEGADAVVHAAGLTTAPDRATFEAGNVTGTLNLLEAAKAVGVARFVHVSSLAACHPELSDYGWSKAKGETLVAASGLGWTIVRPPAVYGPGDRDHLELFKMAKLGILPMSPTKRLSVIEVSDLCGALLAMIDQEDCIAQTYELDDGRPNGWSAESFARAIGFAADTRPIVFRLPKFALRVASMLEGLVRGDKARLTRDRVGYMAHEDWTIDPAKRPPSAVWTPQINTRGGLKATALAYRAAGLL